MEFPLQKGSAPALLRQLAQLVGADVQQDCQKRFIQLPDEFGEVEIYSYNGVIGLDTIIVQGEFSKETTLDLSGNFAQPLCFYTQSHGHTMVRADDQSFVINPLQCTIHGGFISQPYRLVYPSDESVRMMVTFIHRKAFFEEIDCGKLDLPEPMRQNIVNKDPQYYDFLFQDIYHLPAINCLNDLLDDRSQGMQHSAFAAAKIYENVYLQIRQYTEASSKRNPRIVRDEQRIEIIRNAERILVSRLQDAPTIPELARMAGINQQTLKQGFRQLYGWTINQYLNEKRLEQAGLLIRGGKMSLGEVAQAVGYANGGYFSRRFKEKYGVSPKQFSSRSRLKVV